MRRRTFLILAVLVSIAGFLYLNQRAQGKLPGMVASVVLNKNEVKEEPVTSHLIDVGEKWDLPPALKEVSGIAYLDEARFACVQDEEGSVFIYNRVTGEIEKTIPFAGPGDYEGIAINGSMAWIIRADGRIYEIDMNDTKTKAREYETPLTAANNIEALCYDNRNNRLLLGVKDKDPEREGHKGIYAFDIATRTFNREPVYRIDLKDEVFADIKGKKKKPIMPSAIGIHPKTREIYITDGTNPGLLVLDSSGNPRQHYKLGKYFTQPEGLTFSKEGEVFISNEGVKGPANIVRIRIRE